MKRKLKDPKEWEKRKNKLLITVAKIKRPPQDEAEKKFACNIMERLVVGSEANE